MPGNFPSISKSPLQPVISHLSFLWPDIFGCQQKWPAALLVKVLFQPFHVGSKFRKRIFEAKNERRWFQFVCSFWDSLLSLHLGFPVYWVSFPQYIFPTIFQFSCWSWIVLHYFLNWKVTKSTVASPAHWQNSNRATVCRLHCSTVNPTLHNAFIVQRKTNIARIGVVTIFLFQLLRQRGSPLLHDLLCAFSWQVQMEILQK